MTDSDKIRKSIASGNIPILSSMTFKFKPLIYLRVSMSRFLSIRESEIPLLISLGFKEVGSFENTHGRSLTFLKEIE